MRFPAVRGTQNKYNLAAGSADSNRWTYETFPCHWGAIRIGGQMKNLRTRRTGIIAASALTFALVAGGAFAVTGGGASPEPERVATDSETAEPVPQKPAAQPEKDTTVKPDAEPGVNSDNSGSTADKGASMDATKSPEAEPGVKKDAAAKPGADAKKAESDSKPTPTKGESKVKKDNKKVATDKAGEQKKGDAKKVKPGDKKKPKKSLTEAEKKELKQKWEEKHKNLTEAEKGELRHKWEAKKRVREEIAKNKTRTPKSAGGVKTPEQPAPKK